MCMRPLPTLFKPRKPGHLVSHGELLSAIYQPAKAACLQANLHKCNPPPKQKEYITVGKIHGDKGRVRRTRGCGRLNLS